MRLEAELLLATAGAGGGLVIVLVRGAGATVVGASPLGLLLLFARGGRAPARHVAMAARHDGGWHPLRC